MILVMLSCIAFYIRRHVLYIRPHFGQFAVDDVDARVSADELEAANVDTCDPAQL